MSYTTNALGQVLSRTEKDEVTTGDEDVSGDPKQMYFYFDGLVIGDIGNDGPSETDYATAIADRNDKPSLSPWSDGACARSPISTRATCR